jgi:16S rRNA (uracil1498-N3)-methyltransferase
VNLILFEPHELSSSDVVLADGRAAHLLQVLKVSPGQTIRVGVVDGPLGTATVTNAADGRVALRCVFDRTIPAAPSVDLLLALPRPKVMRRLWAQVAALGVRRIMLTNAARVERNYFDTHVLRPACYRPLLLEGLQQARDTRLPIVSIHRQLKVLVEDDLDALTGEGLRILGDPAAAASVGVVMREHAADRVLLAVGAEGGWSDYELGLLSAHGFQRAGMGPRLLRVDTACIALLTLVHSALSSG